MVPEKHVESTRFPRHQRLSRFASFMIIGMCDSCHSVFSPLFGMYGWQNSGIVALLEWLDVDSMRCVEFMVVYGE
jgi:hypothetical protein